MVGWPLIHALAPCLGVACIVIAIGAFGIICKGVAWLMTGRWE